MNKNNEETPTTSRTSKKFHGISNTRRVQWKALPQTTRYSSSQVATKKLLRSIKRRDLQQIPTPHVNTGPALMGKFHSTTPNIRSGVKQIRSPMEEGELASYVEPQTPASVDDDCICIEPSIEQIILIDDSVCELDKGSGGGDHDVATTAVATARNDTSKGYDSLLEYLVKRSENSAASTSTPCQRGKPAYYEDISGTPWFETAEESNDTIHVDDTTLHPDDSVIFVGETKGATVPSAPDFIPLTHPNMSNIRPNPYTPKAKKNAQLNNALFTASEKKQLRNYNNNMYVCNVQANDKRRMVIIDGSNVAFCHALNKEFSVKGLQICLEYFEKMGHEVKAVVPQFRLQRFKSSDPDALEQLHRQGKIVFTPCKNLPGKCSTSYDDRFILQLACNVDAAIVSNDNYRDLLNENAAFKKIIENRVVGYTWCNDVFMLPKDPYGRWGPTLQSILNRDSVS